MEFISSIPQFTQYLISSILYLLKRKWEWYITSNINKLHLPRDISEREKNLKNSVNSTVQLFHVHRQSWRLERQRALLHICVICLTVDIQLTSGSAFISRNVIGTGPSYSSASEPSFTFIFKASFAS
jgi:hypothetical protein